MESQVPFAHDDARRSPSEFEPTSKLADPVKLSEKLWNIPWRDYFPLQLGAVGETVEISDFATVSEFYRKHFSEIFEGPELASPFLANRCSSAQSKARYYQEAGDFFVFKSQQEIVGVFIGTPVDWGTYYIRNSSLLPKFQGGKRYQSQVLHLLNILAKHGVERVEVDTAPSNMAIIHIHNKFQFNVSGVLVSERWGTLLHFTKFLDPDFEKVFLQQFCHGVRPQVQLPNSIGRRNRI